MKMFFERWRECSETEAMMHKAARRREEPARAFPMMRS